MINEKILKRIIEISASIEDRTSKTYDPIEEHSNVIPFSRNGIIKDPEIDEMFYELESAINKLSDKEKIELDATVNLGALVKSGMERRKVEDCLEQIMQIREFGDLKNDKTEVIKERLANLKKLEMFLNKQGFKFENMDQVEYRMMEMFAFEDRDRVFAEENHLFALIFPLTEDHLDKNCLLITFNVEADSQYVESITQLLSSFAKDTLKMELEIVESYECVYDEEGNLIDIE